MTYVAMWSYDYEGSGCICAFKKQAAAEAFVKACNDHHATKPRFPDEDSEYDAYCAAEEKWRADHPAKEHASADSFHVAAIELR